MGTISPLSGIPQAAPALGTGQPKAMGPRFGQAVDTVRFGNDDENADAGKGKKKDDGPGVRQRIKAAMADAFNMKLLMSDALFATLISAVLAIPSAFVFTPVLIPCVMAAQAIWRGAEGYMRGEPKDASQVKGFRIPFLNRKPKTENTEE